MRGPFGLPRQETSTRNRHGGLSYRGSHSTGPLVGVYWGRFNPPHKGHMEVIRRFSKKCRLVIAVGSSEQKDTRPNPFDGSERVAMLRAYLREEHVHGVKVIAFRDGPSIEADIDELVERSHADFLILSTEKRELSRIARKRVKVIGFRRRGSISSTRLRDLIASGSTSWKRLTGASVAGLVVRHRGLSRIREAYGR